RRLAALASRIFPSARCDAAVPAAMEIAATRSRMARVAPEHAHLTDEIHVAHRGSRVADRRCRGPCVRALRGRGTGVLPGVGGLLVRRLHVESHRDAAELDDESLRTHARVLAVLRFAARLVSRRLGLEDVYAIYKDGALATQHPEWILRDQSGNELYIPYGCSG